MCRFMVYLGTPCLLADLVTKPSRSLTRQSYDAKERLTGHGYLNGDGFGIGWYSTDAQHVNDPTPCVFSSIQPAWNNQNLERLANKIISPLIFAHVRAAYPGIAVNDSNCQPFTCGRYMWMHNGGVGGFQKVRRKLLNSLRDDVYEKCPSFESDSAICFGLFLNHIEDPMQVLSPEELVALMEATINDIRQIQIEAGVENEESLLNFVVSDGHTVVATRYCNLPSFPAASLYYAFGSKFECVDKQTNTYFVQHQDRRGQIGIVASEPLSDSSADWIRVPQNHMVVMSRFKGQFLDLLLVPIGAPSAVSRDLSRSFKALSSCTKQASKVSVSSKVFIRGLSHKNANTIPAASSVKQNPQIAGSEWAPSPDGVPLVTKPRHSLEGQRCPILSLAVDGNRVFAGFQDGYIRIYDLSDFALIHTFQAHRQNIFSLAVHGGLLYTSSTRVVKIWDLRTLELRAHLRYSDGDVFALGLALGRSVAGPAGTTIVACSPKVTSSSQPGVQAQRIAQAQSKSRLPTVAEETSGRPSGQPKKNSDSAQENGETTGKTEVTETPGTKVPGVPGVPEVGSVCANTESEGVWEIRHGLQKGGMEDSVGNLMTLAEKDKTRDDGSKSSEGTPEASSSGERQAQAVFDRLASSQRQAVPSSSIGSPSQQPPPIVVTRNSEQCKRGGGTETVQCAEVEAALALTDSLKGGHCSRVYALALCGSMLCSGGGDSYVKAWDLEKGECVGTLSGHKGSVLCLAPFREPSSFTWTLLSGSRDNTIRLWDLSTMTCVTTLTGHVDDVVALDIAHPECKGFRRTFLSASTDQTVRLWSLESFECLRIFLAEDTNIMSLASCPTGFVTGSSDGVVQCWELGNPSDTAKRGLTPSSSFRQKPSSSREEHQLMEETLAQLVRIRSVNQERTPASAEQGWKAANFLMGLLESIGAEAKLVVAVEDTNPIVFGRIIHDPSKLTVTICGHYDVVDVASDQGWATPPFELTAVNGNLYGRGVSSTKGPLLATLFAVKELVCSNQLSVNLNFVIDGEHERGCRGFKEAVTSNAEWFEDTGLILSASGAWVSDDQPCLTYGMRGLICLVVEVSGPLRDLHSGTHGGVFNEPTNDLLTVLSNLVDSNNMILIPGFYDDVKAMDEEEERLFNRLHLNLEEYKRTSGLKALSSSTPREVLQSCWREPSLSVVSVDTSPGTWSLIPKKCSARVVIRHVPNQNPERLIERFKAHVAHEFAKLRSRGNSINVHVQHVGDWWLADPCCNFYKLAESVVEKQWEGAPPTMYIREGGTMHIVPFLERALGAPAIIVPISQATDYSALQNERLSLKHFQRGKNVIRDFLVELGKD